MPLHYQGVVQEHLAVRNSCGIFDVSHMGVISITGKNASRFIDYLSTNDLSQKKDGSVTYTVFCHANGGSVDDLLVYRKNEQEWFVIANASNRGKDLAHITTEARNFTDVQVQDHFKDCGILAIQGPDSEKVISKLFPSLVIPKRMRFEILDQNTIIARTGYTGSDGFEVIVPSEDIEKLWESALKLSVIPAGLGARDTLRLEMGYALYGHEIDDGIAPIESVSGWTVKLDKSEFIGKLALKNWKNKRSEYGVILDGKGVARADYQVFRNGKLIGKVTSGNYAPSLQKSIAIILVEDHLEMGERIDIAIRDQFVPAHIVKLPFYHIG